MNCGSGITDHYKSDTRATLFSGTIDEAFTPISMFTPAALILFLDRL